MKKFLLLLTLITTIVFAQNPSVYAALGDVIYNNAVNIEKLKNIKAYENEVEKIDDYLAKVATLKEEGFAIERGDKNVDKKAYLNALRKLSSENDYFVRGAKKSFKDSMSKEDSQTFEKIINTGLINTQRNKDTIINYYFAHQEDVNTSGVIQSYLDEDAKLLAKREAQKKYYKTKKQLEAEKIKRIRKNDKEKQAELEKKLDAEVTKKKEEIIKEQKKELFN